MVSNDIVSDCATDLIAQTRIQIDNRPKEERLLLVIFTKFVDSTHL